VRRLIQEQLGVWKDNPKRKPLILRGARQVGKTHALRVFGRTCFESVAYFDFEREPELSEFFSGTLDPRKLIRNLQILAGVKIEPGKTLIVLDEIQACNAALKSLKYFFEEAPEYHVAAAGSLLGMTLSKPASFPAGKVDFLDVHPMRFTEFLEAHGEDGLVRLITQPESLEHVPHAFHDKLVDYLKRYMIVGGMPEVVHQYVETEDLTVVRGLQDHLLDAFVLDMAKHADPTELPKLRQIWDTIPAQLARENKKFTYSLIKKSARARDFSRSLTWLEFTGQLIRATRITKPGWPPAGYAEASHFKMYYMDVGLLSAMAKLEPSIVLAGDALFREFHGAIAESLAAQMLCATGNRALYYWTGQGTSEVDFVVTPCQKILPLEIKAGINTKAKSLHVYRGKYNPALAIRANQLNVHLDKGLLNLPLYALESLDAYVAQALQSG